MRIPKIQVLHVAASVAQRGRVWAGGLREGVTRREIMRGVKVTVYTLLMNYSYETFYCCWAESLLLAQILMMYYESAPKIMSCN